VINSRDVTERKAVEERLAYQAFHDFLTDLPNRALFMDRLGHSLARAGRRGGRVALLFADLDNLKQVNDTLGHEAGDEILKAVAGRLRSELRPEDTVARLGGDEFVVLLEDVGGVDEAARGAERVVEALRFPFARRGRDLSVTASVGVALSAARALGDRPKDLLRAADRAMYRAKRRGKARYEIIDPDTDAAPGHPSAGNDLGRVLDRASSPYRTSGG
jgi:diguanylate cyclase (GGDEF)-like protein